MTLVRREGGDVRKESKPSQHSTLRVAPFCVAPRHTGAGQERRCGEKRMAGKTDTEGKGPRTTDDIGCSSSTHKTFAVTTTVTMPADLYGREVKRRKQGDVPSPSISSSSFLSLKAELAKHQSGSSSSSGSSSRPIGDDPGASTASSSRQRDDYSLPSASSSKRRGEADEASLLSGSFSKPTRKLPAHLRPSPSTALRASKDSSHSSSSSPSPGTKRSKSKQPAGGSYTLSSWSTTPSAQLERDRNLVLERKARLYDQLKRGLSGGLDEEDLRDEGRLGGLVDWERKVEEGGSESESEEDEEPGEGEGEEMVEFQDELGRTRMLPRSQVPMAQLIEMKRREEEAEAAK